MALSSSGTDPATLATHKLVRMRTTAASHPDATAALLTTLAGDPSGAVRRIVAARSATPPSTLGMLAADPDRATRQAVADNPHTPPEALIACSTTATSRSAGRPRPTPPWISTSNGPSAPPPTPT